MKELVTPKQVAQAIGVSEASLKRWCDQGKLPVIRTAGGHRRLPINGVIQWLRETGHPVVRPEVLELPSNTGIGNGPVERSLRLLKDAMQAGDEERCRQIVVNLYLTGHPMVDLCDRVIAPTFEALGSAWQHGDLEVYQERRGCEISAGMLRELKAMLPATSPNAPYAIGGTLTGDPYVLPNAMVELVLREAGWRAESHGCGNPAATLAAAIDDRRPNLFWLSVSAFETEESFLASYHLIQDAAERHGVPIVGGGRILSQAIRQQMTGSVYCDDLRHLVTFAEALTRSMTWRNDHDT